MDRIDGRQICDKDTRVIIGDDSIVFKSLNSTDATNYIVQATNAADVQMAVFYLSLSPCEFEFDYGGCIKLVHTSGCVSNFALRGWEDDKC